MVEILGFEIGRKKKSRSGYEFSKEDRSYGHEIQKINRDIKKTELMVKRQRLRNLRTEAVSGTDQSQSGGIDQLLHYKKQEKQLKELFKQEEPDIEYDDLVEGDDQESAAEKFVMEMLMNQVKDKMSKGGENNDNRSEEPIKPETESKVRQSSSSGEGTDAIINSIPPHLRKAIQSGLISKAQFDKEAQKVAKEKAAQVWKKLKEGRNRSPKRLNTTAKRSK